MVKDRFKLWLLCLISTLAGQVFADSFNYECNPDYGDYTTTGSSGTTFSAFIMNNNGDSYDTSQSCKYDNGVIKATVVTINSSSEYITINVKKQDNGKFYNDGKSGKIWLYDVDAKVMLKPVWFKVTEDNVRDLGATYNNFQNFTGTHRFRVFMVKSDNQRFYGGEIKITGSGITFPSVSLDQVELLSPTSAKISGYVTSNGAKTTAMFRYGTDYSLNTYETTNSKTFPADASGSLIEATLTGLTPGETYSYELYAYNSEGEKTSNIDFFTTESSQIDDPVYPSSPSPSDGAQNVSTSGTFSWSCGDNIVSYDLYLATDAQFKNRVGGSNTYNSGQGNTCSYRDLTPGQTYYWKVCVWDNNNKSYYIDGDNSKYWTFTTSKKDEPSGDDMTADQAAQYLYEKGVIDNKDTEGNILRCDLAKIAFRGLYSTNGRTVGSVPSDNFPTVYNDIAMKTSANEYYYKAAKALLYLEYGDGVTPFDRNRLEFDPKGTIARIHVLKALLETFNIQPNMSGTDYFPNDDYLKTISKKDPRLMGYIRAAGNLGIINTTNEKFHPTDPCKRGEAFLMLVRIMTKLGGDIKDPDPQKGDYFEPLNVTLKTISLGLGISMGNFRHYTKTSFAINGTVPLAFAHTYNSYNTTLPDVFYAPKETDGVTETYKPLGDGWSHNYHSYLTIVGSGDDQRVIVHWGGGRIDVYKYNNGKFEPESYGVYDKLSVAKDHVTIKSKSQTEYTFSNQGGTGILYMTKVTDRYNNTLTLDYENGESGFKRISMVTSSDCEGKGSRSLSFYYDQPGTDLLTRVSDPKGRKIQFDYELNSNTGRYQLKSYTNAMSQTTYYEYGDNSKTSTSKLLARIRLPKGNIVENQYDSNCRLTQTVNADSKTTIDVSPSYNGSVSISSSVAITRNNSTTSTYKYQYNGNNMATSMSGPKGLKVSSEYYTDAAAHLPKSIETNSTKVSNIEYDENGNLLRIDVKGDNGETLTTKLTYTTLNDIETITDPMNNTTTYYYNYGYLNKIQLPDGSYTKIDRKNNGLIEKITNPEGIETQFDYNPYGNLIEVISPLSLRSIAQYDDVSRLESVTDALNRTHKFSYDDNDNLKSETTPKGYITNFVYDDNDNLVTIRNAKHKETILEYDYDTDRLTSVSFGGATKSYKYNPDGSLKSYTKPDFKTLNYKYDDLGRITSDGVNSYSYDSNTLQLSSISGNGKTIDFYYDGFNRIKQAGDVSYKYDKNGNCTSINETEYGYDKLNRLTSVTFNSKTINYSYKKDGRLEKVEYPNGMTTTYGFDKAGRLTSKVTKLKDGTIVASYEFELDKAGNIIKQTAKEPFSEILLTNGKATLTYNDANRIKTFGDIGFEFDENGNTLKRESEQYQWDYKDRLVRAGDTDIKYDPLGLIASYGDITFKTNPLGVGNVLGDSKGSEYIYGNGLEARIKDGKTSYYVTDFRGSVVAIVDENGNITHKYQYDAFGKVTQKEEADYNPFQYVGKYGVMYLTDHQYYMRARHYDPTIGRFLSEDPIWSTNLYPYADNNPIMGIDPNGKLNYDTRYGYYGLEKNDCSTLFNKQYSLYYYNEKDGTKVLVDYNSFDKEKLEILAQKAGTTISKINNGCNSQKEQPSKNSSYDHITHNVEGYNNSIDASYVNAYMAETHPISKNVMQGAEYLNKNVSPTFDTIQDGMSDASDAVGGFFGRLIISLFE